MVNVKLNKVTNTTGTYYVVTADGGWIGEVFRPEDAGGGLRWQAERVDKDHDETLGFTWDLFPTRADAVQWLIDWHVACIEDKELRLVAS